MALIYTQPGFVFTVALANGTFISNLNDYGGVYKIDLSGMSDAANETATFDTQHEVFNSSILDAASQNSTGDNSQGLENPLHLEPELTYTYSTGYTTSHEKSQAVTVGLTQSFSYDVFDIGGSTTLSASGTLTWSESTGETKTTSVTEGGTYPFDVPQFKIYEEKLLFTQQSVAVPYSSDVMLSGFIKTEYEDSSTDTFSLGDMITLLSQNAALPSYPSVNWADVAVENLDDVRLTLSGTLTIQGAGTATVKIYDITNGDSQVMQADYDAAVPVGIHRTMDDVGRAFSDTPFDDYVDGGAGNDHIRLSGGEDIVHAAGGDDTIEAAGGRVGRSLLDGGDGDDRIDLTSSVAFSHIMGGAGGDRIRVDAPAALIDGGAGDDGFWLNGATAGGTVIVDTQGANHLEIDTGGAPLRFERVPNSDNLYILLDCGETYDRTRDVVWVDFFADPDNQVDGLIVAEVDDLAVTFRPAVPAASADFA